MCIIGDDGDFRCHKCDRSFRTRRGLGGHKRGHTIRERREAVDLAKELENPNFECTICSQSFPAADSLSVHLRTHSETTTDASQTGIGNSCTIDTSQLPDLSPILVPPQVVSRRDRLGKAPKSEPVSETDESDTDSDYDMRMARAYDRVLRSLDRSSDLSKNSYCGKKKPRLDHQGCSNSLVIRDNDNNVNAKQNTSPYSGNKNDMTEKKLPASKPKYNCTICGKKIQGSYALGLHMGFSHNNNNSRNADEVYEGKHLSGSNRVPTQGPSNEVSRIEGQSSAPFEFDLNLLPPDEEA